MSRTLEGIPVRILEEAAAWFASFADPPVSEQERRRWEAWLAADPDHARAWKRVESITARIAPIADAGDAARNALESPRRRGRRNALRALSVLLLAGGGGLLASRLPLREWRHDVAVQRAVYRTERGQVSYAVLPDGSRIWLGGASLLDFDYGSNLRRLAFSRGDLLVETSQDKHVPARPFVVDTDHARLRALGTRFAVRSDDASGRVDVFEGSVEIAPVDSGRGVHVVHASEHAIFNRSGVLAAGTSDPNRETWSRGILLADRMRLDDLIAEVSRWNAASIVCDPAVAGLRVVGAYPLRDVERILAALDATLPVNISREDGLVRIRAGAPRTATLQHSYDTPPRRLE